MSIWDQVAEYYDAGVPLLRPLIQLMAHRLRLWDVSSASRVDTFVANSSFVAQRVRKYYRRESQVVHPPVEIGRFNIGEGLPEKGEYYLAAGALVPYKRFDLAIRACESLGKKLVIAGSGPEEKRLRSIAQKCTSFRIAPSDAELRKLMRQAKGFIFPGVEDFGIIAIETLASGTPIIGYHRVESSIMYRTKEWVLFKEQTPESLGDPLSNRGHRFRPTG